MHVATTRRSSVCNRSATKDAYLSDRHLQQPMMDEALQKWQPVAREETASAACELNYLPASFAAFGVPSSFQHA